MTANFHDLQQIPKWTYYSTKWATLASMNMQNILCILFVRPLSQSEDKDTPRGNSVQRVNLGSQKASYCWANPISIREPVTYGVQYLWFWFLHDKDCVNGQACQHTCKAKELGHPQLSTPALHHQQEPSHTETSVEYILCCNSSLSHMLYSGILFIFTGTTGLMGHCE